MQGDSYSCDMAESKYDNQMLNRRDYIQKHLVLNYNTHCQIIKNVSTYGILTTQKVIKLSLFLLLPLIFASRCLPYKTPTAVSQHIWTP